MLIRVVVTNAVPRRDEIKQYGNLPVGKFDRHFVVYGYWAKIGKFEGRRCIKF
jgi:hypothetical protein